MTLRRLIAFLIILASFLQCATDKALPSEADINVLFVGNSLTYVNDLSSLVAEIAKMDGVHLTTTTLAEGDYSFDDHLADGTIQQTLKTNSFDFLIGQQGPSALSESQVLLRESSLKIAAECRKVNTTFCLYMVWPSLARDFDRDNCIASYTNAAKASNALLCPAGLAWKLAWQKDPRLPLYGPDDFHPGIHGSVLAAIVIYAAIKEKKDLDFIDRSKASWGRSVSDEQFTVMKAAALSALASK